MTVSGSICVNSQSNIDLSLRIISPYSNAIRATDQHYKVVSNNIIYLTLFSVDISAFDTRTAISNLLIGTVSPET